AVKIWAVVPGAVNGGFIRINVWCRGCATTATGTATFLVNAVGRVQVKPLRAGAFDGGANKVLRCRGVLGVVAAHAVGRVEKTNQGRAVADSAAKGNFTLSVERLMQRQCFIEPGAIIGHAASVKFHTGIAAKRLAADFTPALSA